MSPGRRLVLFDIDGTLLKCGPQVKGLFAEMLVEVFGTAGAVLDYDFAGKTDDRIAGDVLAAAGLEQEEIAAGLPRARAQWGDRLERGLDRDRMQLLPGVADTLERLSSDGDVALGLLTGNWAVGARVKLGRFGLNRYFAFGAFGDGVSERRRLPPRALAAAKEHTGYDFGKERTVIVGDTLHDVDCARSHGIASLGVATGPASLDGLRSAGADWVAADLASAATLPPMTAA